MVYWDLLIGALLYGLGFAFFGPFEARTPLVRRISKAAVFFAIAVFVSWRFGPVASLGWILGMLAVGLTFHAWWTRKHGISFLRPEPKERYYRLRGWPLESEADTSHR